VEESRRFPPSEVKSVTMPLSPHVNRSCRRSYMAQEPVQLRVIALKNAIAVGENLVSNKNVEALACVTHLPEPTILFTKFLLFLFA
jgi:hypothetical protein